MKISIISVGNKMPAWVNEAYQEYAKRLPKDLQPKLIELPLAARGKNVSVEKVKELEGEQILAAIPKQSHAVMLDVLGKSMSTPALADTLAQWQMHGTDISLVIGGPDGLSVACKQRADRLWSLSELTLPHPLVRVVLIEQLYRAWTITQNHPYHKS